MNPPIYYTSSCHRCTFVKQGPICAPPRLRSGGGYAKNPNIDLSLLEHISPIGWENIILYGEYVLNRS